MTHPRHHRNELGGASSLYRFTVAEHQDGRRLSSILNSNHSMSRRLLRKLIVQESVFVNGHHAHMSTLMHVGDTVCVQLPDEVSNVEPENIPLDICYEDEFVLVVNKPVGMLTHPSARERTGSLLAAAAYYLKSQNLVPHSIHRLDKYTSGAILVAKHAHAHHLFDEALRNRLIHRHYVALVYSPDDRSQQPPTQLIDFIAQDPNKPSRRMIGDSSTGQEAITNLEILSAVPPIYACRFSLETGRTHQIRLQMASRGMPLVGDRDYTHLYGGLEDTREANYFQRVIAHQALHAYELIWRTPLDSQNQTTFAPVRPEMEELWSFLGGERKLTALVSEKYDLSTLDVQNGREE